MPSIIQTIGLAASLLLHKHDQPLNI